MIYNLMLCDHKKAKMKLMSWATKDRTGHRQGFKMKLACELCGRIIHDKVNTKLVVIGSKSV